MHFPTELHLQVSCKDRHYVKGEVPGCHMNSCVCLSDDVVWLTLCTMIQTVSQSRVVELTKYHI